MCQSAARTPGDQDNAAVRRSSETRGLSESRMHRRVLCPMPAVSTKERRGRVWGGLAPRTPSRRFVKETGLSFAQCRQQARSLRALELIADGVAVTTIALELGDDNVRAFIDMFRRALRTA